ncbi:putative WD repeat-containing protein [Escovopsis weberi]|uniref:Putative WD repeat-containing protein n=1 Tax=Escovopsis weberi TaxID=150374 RepID=A0A0M8NAF8_ESCWE|nr:putative WD repeat-containing protein [Escovopsis weberi]
MSQSHQMPPSRRQQSGTISYGAQHNDELHMSGLSPRIQASSRDYPPQIKLDQSPAGGQLPPATNIPSVLQPGGLSPNMPSNAAQAFPMISASESASSALASMSSSSSSQLQQLQQSSTSPPAKQPLNLSHAYSLSTPAANYDATSSSSSYQRYTPTTPGASAGSQFMSPQDAATRYASSGAQRKVSNTPLGLADIRPRADSSMSEGTPGTLGYEVANTQPGPSNYLAPWPLYAFDWCKWSPRGSAAGKVAMGSYLEDGHNFIQILDTQIVPSTQDSYGSGTSKYSLEFTKIAEATHSYPVTRLLWEPPSTQKQSTDLLATSGDHLRLWSLPAETSANPGNTITRPQRDAAITKLTPLALLSNSKTPDHTAPLTSLDWNTVSPSLIITSSIDTTCTIWDIPSLTAKTQLIAHDKEVYDVRFCAKSVDVFVSCGQDGSVRMFDLRSLEHSTIIYEPTGKEERGERMSPTLAQQTMTNPPPLLRLATSPHDTHLLATFAADSQIVRILDVRQPGQALLELRGHTGPINCIEWSPSRRGTLASGADDCQVLLWDLMSSTSSVSGPPLNGGPQQDNHRSPVASLDCEYEVANLGWVPNVQGGDYGEWLGVCAGRGVWGAKV